MTASARIQGGPARRRGAWRTGVAVALLASALALLGGCAGLRSLLPKPQEAAAPGAAASAPAPLTAAQTERADYLFEVVAPDTVRGLLATYLDLARFQTAPTADGITTAELDRLLRSAPAQARSLLETEGYFNAEIAVERVADPAANKPLLRMTVAPGPRTLVSEVRLDATGDIAARIAAGDAGAARELESLRRDWPLKVGEPFRQTTWDAAKVSTLGRLRSRGYPAANWSGTNAGIDASANTARLQLAADSGPLFRLGEIRIEGLERYDADAVRRLSTFSPGTPYDEQLLLDFQERVQKLGLFEGASVELDATPDNAAAAPVVVKVKELSGQQATFGVGYGTNTGPRFSVEHFHRRPFGRRWIAHTKLEYGPESKVLDTEITSYPLANLYRNLVAGSLESLRSVDDEVRNSWSLRAGRRQDTTRIDRLYYAEVAHSRIESRTNTTEGDAVSANAHWVFRKVDNVLLPTLGLTLTAQSALGWSRGNQRIYATGATESARGPFARAYGRLTYYRPFGADWYATLRAEAGQVFTRNVVGVPDTLLFRAGGDDSVRGYAYRSLGPEIGGAVSSGRVLLTGSAEVARPISPRYPAFLWAAFLDAGNAADRWGDLEPVLGYGVGLRWRSPVGPLRLDVAYGQEVSQVRVHFSVGIAF